MLAIFTGFLDTTAVRLGLHFDEMEYPSPRQRVQARIVFAFQLAYASTWLAYVVLYAMLGAYISAGICLFVGVLPSAIGVALLGFGHRFIMPAGLLSNLSSASALFLLTFTTGGAGSAIIVWLLVVVVGTYLQLGKRMGHMVSSYIFTLVVIVGLLDSPYGNALYELPFPEGTVWFICYNYTFAIFIAALIIAIFTRQFEEGYEALQKAELRYRLLLSHSPVGIFHYDTNLILTYCNDRFADMLHNSRERLVGLDMKQLRDQAILPVINKVLMGESGHYEGPYSATLSDIDIWVDLICAPSRDENGNITGGVGIAQDITERKYAEELLHKRTRELELHNRTLAEINRHTALADLLDHVVRHVEELNPGMLCSILVLDKDGKTLRHGAAPSLPDFYNQAIDGVTIGDGVGSCGTAAYRGERIIVEDVQQHPFWAPYRDLARQAGVQSCWSQPIKNNQGQVIGIFAVYHELPTYPTESELVQIEQYANLVQIVLESTRAQNELHIAATAFDSKDGMLICDVNNNILRVNQAFTNITGYEPEEIVGRNPRILSSGRQGTEFYSAMWGALNTVGMWEGEVWNRRKNGEIFPEHLSITVVKDAQGIITNYVASISDITLRKSAEDEIRSLAYYDTLTKLPNRRLLMDRLKHALASSARSGLGGAILFIDLDNFKSLNDTLGHDVGDQLLQQVAQRLESCVREGDTVARLGGDEFVVMLEDLSKQNVEAAEQAKTVGEKILDSLNRPYQLAEHNHRSTPSIGVTLFRGHEQLQDELLKQADIAMYQAKKAGRNTLQFFDPQMQDTIIARATLESDLRSSIAEQEEFQLYYQAQVDSWGGLVGAEALLRWLHPKRGMVSPAEFIPLAEESGLILPLGHWVMATACQQLAVWAARPETAHLTLSVNVSVKQFNLPTFVDEVLKLVDYFKIDPEKLKLEITESMLLSNVEDIIIKISTLKNHGVSFSMDDFGTGYSSLSYLKRLPLSQLKIDQSFVRDVLNDPNDAAIAKIIITLAQTMNLEVIAEGVETEAQREFLELNGCHAYQGYLFSKPVPIEDFEALLKG